MTTQLDVLLAERALATGRAQLRATVRHVHLSKRPMFLVAFQPAAEPFSALGVALGQSAKDVIKAVVIEPRNRTLLFRAMLPVAQRFNAWMRSFAGERVPIGRNDDDDRERTVDAPQLIVANSGMVNLLEHWGRRFAYLQTSGAEPADPALVEFGRHLQFLAGHASMPGQAIVVPATALLRRHFRTGQSDLEDENLAALDAWVAPPAGTTGQAASLNVEDIAVGPLLQPDDDNEAHGLIANFGKERKGSTDEALVRRLEPALHALMAPHLNRAFGLVSRAPKHVAELPEGSSVAGRWVDDCIAYTGHVDWTSSGGFRRARDSAQRAARLRLRLEKAQGRLEAEEAADDPLTMAGYELIGKAIHGRIVSVDPSHKDGPRKIRPLIVLETEHPSLIPSAKALWWSERPGQLRAEVVSTASHGKGSRVTLKVTAGMRGDLPVKSKTAWFCQLSASSGGPSLPIPKEVPWTHKAQFSSTPATIETGPSDRWEETP